MWRDNQVFQASSMRSVVNDVFSVSPRPNPAGFLCPVTRPSGDLLHLNCEELRQAARRSVAPSDGGRSQQSLDGCRYVALSSEAERALVCALRQTVQAVLTPTPKKRRWRTRRRGRKRAQVDRLVTLHLSGIGNHRSAIAILSDSYPPLPNDCVIRTRNRSVRLSSPHVIPIPQRTMCSRPGGRRPPEQR